MGENAGTLEEVYEPYLIKEGFSNAHISWEEGYEKAYKHLGKDLGFYQAGMF